MDFKTVARARASGGPNDTPEKTIGLDGKSYPEGRPKIRIPNNWAPRNYQMNVWRYLERGGKRAICVWHRRAGKDDVCLHWAAASMIDKPATYWHMLPAFSQGRKAIWTAVNPHRGTSFPGSRKQRIGDLPLQAWLDCSGVRPVRCRGG